MSDMPLDTYRLQEWAVNLARHVATISKDPSTRVGAVIFDEKRRLVSAGYNGLPRGVEDRSDRLNARPLKHAMVRHAEQNALSFATGSCEGTTLVCTHPCCSQCAAAIIQAGVAHVLYPEGHDLPGDWRANIKLANEMFEEARVQVHIFERQPAS